MRARGALRAAGCALLAAGLVLALAPAAMVKRAASAPARPGGAPAAERASGAPEADPWGFEEVDWDAWADINPDIGAWLQVPGTSVSTPVAIASAEDPEFYLDHDAWGAWNFAGTPFLDADCAGDFDAGCAPILGHHITGGRMFAELASMADRDWAAGHSVVLLQTPEWRRVYRVAFAGVVDASEPSKRCRFSGPDDFASWWGAELAAADAVLCGPEPPVSAVQLVTCSYTTYANERTVATCALEAQLPRS